MGARLPKGYGKFGYEGRVQLAHRVAWMMFRGPIPDGSVIDHRCHVTSCVNPDHLRLATVKANVENSGGARSKSKSGIRGVIERRPGRWVAQVGHNGRTYYLGTFDTPEQAGEAAAAKRRELFTFPDFIPSS